MSFYVEREHGSDYCIKDSNTKAIKASGLSFEEAEQTADNWNKDEIKWKKNF